MDAPKSLPGAAGHPLFQPRLFFLSWPLLPFAKAAARFVADRPIPYEYHLEPSPRGLMVGAGAAACDGLQLRRLTRSLPLHRAPSLLGDPGAPGWRPANLNWILTRQGSAFPRRSWQASPVALFFRAPSSRPPLAYCFDSELKPPAPEFIGVRRPCSQTCRRSELVS